MEQRGLAYARLSLDQHDLASSASRLLHHRRELAKLANSTEQAARAKGWSLPAAGQAFAQRRKTTSPHGRRAILPQLDAWLEVTPAPRKSLPSNRAGTFLY